MRQNLLFILGALSAMPGAAATDIPDGWSLYDLIPPADRVLLFDYDAEGKKLPILWGFDTAWNDYGNMLRGVPWRALLAWCRRGRGACLVPALG